MKAMLIARSIISMGALPRRTCCSSSSNCSIAYRRSASVTGSSRQFRRHLTVQSVASDALPVYCLPNGLQVKHTSTAAEVQFLYDEQYTQQVYLQHQVTLHPGDVVLDVGANIGMFSMFATEAVSPSGLVLSVEPAPSTAAALTANIQQHASWCAQQGRQSAPCKVIQAAVSDGSQQQAQLTVYKGGAGWSTLLRDDTELANNVEAFITNVLNNTADAGSSNTAGSSSSTDMDSRGWSPMQQRLVAVARWFNSSPLFKPLSSMMSRAYIKAVMMRDVEQVSCKVVTVSQLIEQHKLQRVDLLKVDVERAELQVLQGVTPQHWPLIQQVAMEVHDYNGQLSEVVQLLQHTAGFSSVVAEQDALFKGSNLYNLYAVRR